MTLLPSASFPRRVRCSTCVLSFVLTAVLAGCASGEPPPFRTAPGPESPALLAGVSGRVVVGEGESSCYPLRAIDPSSPPRCVPRVRDAGWDGAVAPAGDRGVLRMRMSPAGGADVDGRRSLSVALQRVADCRDGQSGCMSGVETLATWPSTAEGDLYHQPLAVSPDGRTAAVVPSSHLLKGPGYSPRIPSAARFKGLRQVGALKLVDLRTHAVRDAGIEVVADQPISWSADGKRLLIVRAEPIEALPAHLASGIDGPVGHPGQGIPIVETWDVGSGAVTMLAIGLQPLWSPDGRTLLFRPAHDRLATLDLVDHASRELVLPGMSTRYETIAVAFVAPREVLYWALPTVGADPDFTDRNSPLVGPKQMLSLKVANLDTGQFATVYPRLDPRARVGYRSDSRAE